MTARLMQEKIKGCVFFGRDERLLIGRLESDVVPLQHPIPEHVKKTRNLPDTTCLESDAGNRMLRADY
ncbi:MAG: hypothetical protein HQL90_08460 [Magnetococcales bacterium]|nr:hypothetical protein [Magnetococcales bacterium]